MKEAGCFRIHYGVETGDTEILNKIGKAGLKIEEIRNTFQMTKRAGIFVLGHFIIGLPGETRLTIKKSLNLIYSLDPDSINASVITPYPGTKLFQIAKRNDWIVSLNWEDYTGYNAVMRTAELNIKQLNFARKEMLIKFFIFKILRDKNSRKTLIKRIPTLIHKFFCE